MMRILLACDQALRRERRRRARPAGQPGRAGLALGRAAAGSHWPRRLRRSSTPGIRPISAMPRPMNGWRGYGAAWVTSTRPGWPSARRADAGNGRGAADRRHGLARLAILARCASRRGLRQRQRAARRRAARRLTRHAGRGVRHRAGLCGGQARRAPAGGPRAVRGRPLPRKVAPPSPSPRPMHQPRRWARAIPWSARSMAPASRSMNTACKCIAGSAPTIAPTSWTAATASRSRPTASSASPRQAKRRRTGAKACSRSTMWRCRRRRRNCPATPASACWCWQAARNARISGTARLADPKRALELLLAQTRVRITDLPGLLLLR